MHFHLEFPIAQLDPPIRHDQLLMVEGSCFASEIGQRLSDHKMQVVQQPHGILFNPLSIASALESYLENRIYIPEDLVGHDGLWHSWDHHGSFSDPDPECCLQRIQARQREASEACRKADWLLITLGTAEVFTLNESGRVVANCHKFPQDRFSRELLSPERVIAALDNIMHRLFFVNKKLRLLFSVSPVRYLNQGAVKNQLSKSILHYAVQHLVGKFDRLHYFPAYELVLDDLRDYRFFSEDLVHPNALAQDYVWERFLQSSLDEASRVKVKAVEGLLRAAAHRPLHAGSQAHQAFARSCLQELQDLQQQMPYADFSRERSILGA